MCICIRDEHPDQHPEQGWLRTCLIPGSGEGILDQLLHRLVQGLTKEQGLSLIHI